MKFLLSVAAIIAVATALPTQRGVVTPIAAGPAILVDENNNPIQIGSDFVNGANDFIVVPDAGPITNPAFPMPIFPTPVVNPAPVATPTKSLVQIIVNVNTPPAPAPEPIPIIDVMPVVDPAEIVDPVQVVDILPVVDPVQVVDVMPVVDPVQIIDVMPVVDPVIIDAPVVVEPVQVVDTIVPSPAVHPLELK